MGEIFAAFEGVLAALHGFDEAGFFFEIVRKNVLHQLIGIAALFGGGVRQLRFQFSGDMQFYGSLLL
jgi:hypothetical protein